MSERDTREQIDEEAPYFWFDSFVDQAQRGEISMDEAMARYQQQMLKVGSSIVGEVLGGADCKDDH